MRITLGTVLSTLSAGELKAMADAIQQIEGWTSGEIGTTTR